MQKAFDKMTVKALGDQQPKSCVMCGDEGHVYEHCPLAQRDDEPEQVNSLNNEPSYFPKPPFNRSYSKDHNDQQAWRWKNGNPAPFNNNPSSSNNNNNRNFYNNAAFNNSNNRAPYQGPSKPYVAPVVNEFMHEQGKMNQMIFEQMQQISAQLAGLANQNRQNEPHTTPGQTQPGRLPSQPEINPRGEAKAVTLRSGTHYEGPAMPVEPEAEHTVRTTPIRPVQVEKPVISEEPEPVQREIMADETDYTVRT
jgi:hypothetical protein